MELLKKISPYVFPGVADRGFKLRTVEAVLDVCYGYFDKVDGISKAEIKSKVRKRPLVDARKMLAYIMRNLLGMKVVRIGEELNVDHSTIIHYSATFPDLHDNERYFRKKYEDLCAELEVNNLL